MNLWGWGCGGENWIVELISPAFHVTSCNEKVAILKVDFGWSSDAKDPFTCDGKEMKSQEGCLYFCTLRHLFIGCLKIQMSLCQSTSGMCSYKTAYLPVKVCLIYYMYSGSVRLLLPGSDFPTNISLSQTLAVFTT